MLLKYVAIALNDLCSFIGFKEPEYEEITK